MRQATKGDRVSVHYTGTLKNGLEFDSSRGREPMDVAIGAGRLIKTFEHALLGMTVGAVKTITVSPEDAYGPRHEAMVHVVAREQLPPNLDVAIGMALEATDQAGNPISFRVKAFDDDRVTLDANHPLAGETLNFEIELVAFAADED